MMPLGIVGREDYQVVMMDREPRDPKLVAALSKLIKRFGIDQVMDAVCALDLEPPSDIERVITMLGYRTDRLVRSPPLGRTGAGAAQAPPKTIGASEG